jgi:hypothetical protein
MKAAQMENAQITHSIQAAESKHLTWRLDYDVTRDLQHFVVTLVLREVVNKVLEKKEVLCGVKIAELMLFMSCRRVCCVFGFSEKFTS